MACQYAKCSGDSTFVLLQTLNLYISWALTVLFSNVFSIDCTQDDIASGGDAAEGIMLMLGRRG